MSENYKKGLKATALFGGVKIYSIFISIIKNKFMALLIGVEGMGIAGLLTLTLSIISSVTNLGLGNSAVLDIATANSKDDKIEISRTVIVLRRLVWVTGILGSVIMCILSPWLSKLVFGNDEYTIAFILISITLFFDQLSSGQNALMQGIRKYNYLAKANFLGQTIGLLISVPLYYIYRIDAIVPTLIISSLASLLLSFFFSNKIPIEKIKVDRPGTIIIGKRMTKLGISMSFSGVITIGLAYVLRLYMANKGGIDEVGLYNAGFAIAETYVGLIFTAMGTDYYPRLSSIISDKMKMKNLVSDQAMIGLLLIFPILIAFIIFTPIVIKLLLSSDFLSLIFFLKTVMLGMLFRTCSWTLGYIIMANRDSKLLILSSSIFGAFMFAMNVLFYTFWGIDGLGISYVIIYFCHLLWIYSLVYFKYRFQFNQEVLKYFIGISIVVFASYLISLYTDSLISVIGLCCLLFLSLLFTGYQLEKRSKLLTEIKNKIIKK